MKKEPRSEEYMKKVQHYGEQHPDFHASHREYKKRFPEVFGSKKKALSKMKK